MAFFSFLDDSSGIKDVFGHNKPRYKPIREFAQDIMRGPSSLSVGDRELIGAFVSTLNECQSCAGIHTALAARTIDAAIVQGLVADIDRSTISDRLKPILRFVKKLTQEPARIVQADVDAVFAAGWDEAALGDAIAVCALFNMVNRIANAHGLNALPAERLAELATVSGNPAIDHDRTHKS